MMRFVSRKDIVKKHELLDKINEVLLNCILLIVVSLICISLFYGSDVVHYQNEETIAVSVILLVLAIITLTCEYTQYKLWRQLNDF